MWVSMDLGIVGIVWGEIFEAMGLGLVSSSCFSRSMMHVLRWSSSSLERVVRSMLSLIDAMVGRRRAGWVGRLSVVQASCCST